MEISKKTALKILLLYMLTSCIFLVVVCYGWYVTKKDSILESRIGVLFQETHTLISALYEQTQTQDSNLLESLEIISKELEIPFMLAERNGEIFFSTLPMIQNKAQAKELLQTKELFTPPSLPKGKAHEKIILVEETMYLITQRIGGGFWHYLRKKFENQIPKDTKGLLLVLQTDGVQTEIYTLLGIIALCFTLTLLLMGLIAYLLVSLSLKPLKEKIETLNAFIKDSTHEINTPLSVILMSIERIKTEILPPQEKQKFSRIQLAAKTLERIYQDLLFYTFDEARHCEKEKIPLLSLIAERITYFEPFFQRKNIALHFSQEENFTQTLEANYSHIVRVIDNLLGNALKYTSGGGVVEITLGERFLTIKDNGCGIAKDDLPFIFKKYFRANNQQGGFGIGLALVQQICDFYHITIRCESVLGQGSTFTLSW